jgi:2'-5' RNA ligase
MRPKSNIVPKNGYNMTENTVKKSKCPKKHKPRVAHKTIAYVVNCSPNTVKAIRNDQRNTQTDLGQRIELAEILIEEGQNKLLEKVKELVQFK